MLRKEDLRARCWQIRLKEGSFNKAKEFFGNLHASDEMEKLLKRDKLLVNSFFMERHEGRDYLYLMVKAQKTNFIQMMLNEKHQLDGDIKRFGKQNVEPTTLRGCKLLSDHNNPELIYLLSERDKIDKNEIKARCYKLQIKEGRVKAVKDWFNNHDNNQGVEELLKRDGLLFQSFFMGRHKRKDYLYLFIKSKETTILDMLMNAESELDAEFKDFLSANCDLSSYKALMLLADHNNLDLIKEISY